MTTRRRALLVALVAGVIVTPAIVHAQVARADSAWAAGDRDRAEREYAAVVARDPSNSRAVFRLAQLREKRDPAAAIALYRRYTVLEPRDAWGHMALGDALGAAGDLDAALAAYDQAATVAPNERDVHVGRARLLARAGHTDDAIAAYEAWLARTPRDAEAWRDLASQRRRAGQYGEAATALERAGAKPAEIAKARAPGRATIEPMVGGSHDSDGLTTMRAGATVTSSLIGRARLLASASTDRAGDGTYTRGTMDGSLGIQYRPLAQLRLEVVGGIARADRTFIDTTTAATPATGRGRGVGRVTAPGASAFENFPVGRARLVWRSPGDAIALDARLGRQLLDASPFLVAQGVLRDEANVALDVRLAGSLRARGFARLGSVHNELESNGRQIIGGALAWVPGPYEFTVRAQNMQYDTPTTLAYFAPRYARTAELTTYMESETDGGVTFALDLGAGAQQVADWTSAAATWSPAFRGWAQVVMPLSSSLSLGTELEAYDSRVGDVPSIALPAAKWRYGSANVWLRVAF